MMMKSIFRNGTLLFALGLISFLLCRAQSVSCLSATRVTPQRVALVTGANKGIGKEIARKLATPGAAGDNDLLCLIGCRDVALGEAAAEDLKKSGCDNVAAVVRVDLDDVDSLAEAARRVEREFGRLDVLVNNAAVCFNDPTLYGRVPHTPFEAQADVTVRTNFFGTLELTRAFLPLLRASQSPRIVNVASSAGRLAILAGSPERVDAFSSPGLRLEELEGYMREFVEDVEAGRHAEKGWPNTCYGVSKAGIVAMTRVLARDEEGIMVNSVDPGYCATDQNDNQGFRPAERGAVTPFLLATLPDDQFVTGRHWFDEEEIAW